MRSACCFHIICSAPAIQRSIFTTKYIQFPTPEYDDFAGQVDEALDEAAGFILDKLEYLSSTCAIGNEIIEIGVEGYSDPRAFTEKARYVGDEIADSQFGMIVHRGAAMSNELLSQLRAYYTARALEDKLREDEDYEEIASRVRWNIRGRGIDDSAALPFERKRRVSLRIGIKQ
jgi:hypothetical protein